MSLRDVLLSHAGEASDRIAGVPDLEARLRDLLADARRTWPAFAVSDERFLQHVAQKLSEEPDADAALRVLLGPDLLFACACAGGDGAAIAELEATFMPRAAAYFKRNGSLAPIADELMQLTRLRLLVADGVERPRIAEYSGRAPFGAWFRVVVMRYAINYAAAHKPEGAVPIDRPWASPEPDPELEYLRAHHQSDLDAAFKETLASLPAKTAALLRLYYLENVSPDAIGRVYGVSSRTVQRWVAQMRGKILRETQNRLGARLNMSASQIGGLIAVMQSQVDGSIFRFFDRSEG